MPIVGLTDSARVAFPSLGILRKGAKKDGPGPGRDLEVFRFVSERPEVAEAFAAAYGEAPDRIRCYLPHATPDENLEAWCEEWVAGGLVHRCDGETMVLWRTPEGYYSSQPKPCPYHTGEAQRGSRVPGCKPVGRLSVILPELVRAGFVGYVTVLTTSVHDIGSLTGSLRDAALLRGQHPDGLRGIEWILWRQPQMISTPAPNGKRARRQKWLVKIAPSSEWVQHQISTAHAEALGQLPARTMVALPEPDEAPQADPETGEILSERPEIVAPFEDDDEDGELPDDVEEGEFEPAEPGEEPSNGAGRIRSQVLDLITEREGQTARSGALWRDEPATDAQRKALAMLLDEALEARSKQERYAVYELLTGKADSGAMNMAECGALLAWLAEQGEDGKLSLREGAAEEARVVYRAAMRKQGQQELF